MKRTIYILMLCTAIGLVSPIAWAQDSYRPDNFEPPSATEKSDRIQRKRPGFFHRPKEDSAPEQFAYAADLEKRGRLRSAKSAYNDLVHRWHDSAEGPKAQLRIAHILYDQGKYNKAFKEFQYLVEYYSGRFKYNEVLDRQLRIANQIMGDRWGDILFLPGFEAPERALPLLEAIVANAPNWEKTAGVRLSIGLIYEEIGDLDEAIGAYADVEQHHAGTAEAENAAFRRCHCLYILSKKAPRDEKRCRDALSALASFLARYKQSEKQEEAEELLNILNKRLANMYFERARFYDEIAKRPESALIAYRDFLKRFPSSDKAQIAYARTEALKQDSKTSGE